MTVVVYARIFVFDLGLVTDVGFESYFVSWYEFRCKIGHFKSRKDQPTILSFRTREDDIFCLVYRKVILSSEETFT